VRLLPPLFLLALAPSLVGCKAEVSGSADLRAGGKGKEVADFDKPLEPADLRQAQRAGDDDVAAAALLGARQDLSYAGPATPRCSCLAAAVGKPSHSAFRWSGPKPAVSAESQLVIALSSNGVTCADPAAKGASYWGYEIVGDDVVVTVENAYQGRPVAQGAIIPRPLGKGQVYVQPMDKGVPYARPLEGGGKRCQVSHLAAVAAQPDLTPSGSSGVRIRSDEPDPASTRVDIP
jgi:hypothetical protein